RAPNGEPLRGRLGRLRLPGGLAPASTPCTAASSRGVGERHLLHERILTRELRERRELSRPRRRRSRGTGERYRGGRRGRRRGARSRLGRRPACGGGVRRRRRGRRRARARGPAQIVRKLEREQGEEQEPADG